MTRYFITSSTPFELTQKRSKFIAELFCASSVERARKIHASVKRAHPKARHVVMAWVGLDATYATDDGEPSGTAGKPALSALSTSGVINTCICIVRYFGGTLLGTGGLTRAYREATEGALNTASLTIARQMQTLTCEVGFSEAEALKGAVVKAGGAVLDATYGAHVALTLALPCEQVDAFLAAWPRVAFNEGDVVWMPANEA